MNEDYTDALLAAHFRWQDEEAALQDRKRLEDIIDSFSDLPCFEGVSTSSEARAALVELSSMLSSRIDEAEALERSGAYIDRSVSFINLSRKGGVAIEREDIELELGAPFAKIQFGWSGQDAMKWLVGEGPACVCYIMGEMTDGIMRSVCVSLDGEHAHFIDSARQLRAFLELVR